MLISQMMTPRVLINRIVIEMLAAMCLVWLTAARAADVENLQHQHTKENQSEYLTHQVRLKEERHEAHSAHLAMMDQSNYRRSAHDYQIPELMMIDQEGKAVLLSHILEPEDPVMLNFIFTTCATICPVLSATFSQTQKALGSEAKRVRMVSISIDPEQDTPARLKKYAEHYQANDNWIFLTGSYRDSVTVQRAFNAYRGNKMNHVPLTLMRTSPDKPWLRLEGLASTQDIIREYRTLSNQ